MEESNVWLRSGQTGVPVAASLFDEISDEHLRMWDDSWLREMRMFCVGRHPAEKTGGFPLGLEKKSEGMARVAQLPFLFAPLRRRTSRDAHLQRPCLGAAPWSVRSTDGLFGVRRHRPMESPRNQQSAPFSGLRTNLCSSGHRTQPRCRWERKNRTTFASRCGKFL